MRINRIELKDLQYSFRMFSTSSCIRDIKRPAAQEVPNLLLAQASQCLAESSHFISREIRLDPQAGLVLLLDRTDLCRGAI